MGEKTVCMTIENEKDQERACEHFRTDNPISRKAVYHIIHSSYSVMSPSANSKIANNLIMKNIYTNLIYR